MFVASLTTLSGEGEDTISSYVVGQKSLSTDHAKKERLKLNMGRHDPTRMGVITQYSQN